MNPLELFNSQEIEKIKDISGVLEDRKYTKEEWIRMENNITEYVMSKSTKNGDIAKTREEFNNILNKIEKSCKGNNDEV